MDTKARFTGVPAAATLTILLAAALTAGCGVSKAQYLNLTQNRDDLAARNQQLQASLDAANKDKAQLEASRAELDAHLKEMESTAHQLGTKLEEQQKASEEFKSTYETLIGHLQGELSSGKIEIERMRDGINVNLPQDILFRSGSADLDNVGRELLLKVAGDLKQSTFEVVVTGHTDNLKIGPALASRYPTNWELGSARSARIVRLFEEAGLTKDRLAAVSYSDSRPRQSNGTPEGRAKNRRIEIKLRPTVSEPTASN